jgi:hypothetical protein
VAHETSTAGSPAAATIRNNVCKSGSRSLMRTKLRDTHLYVGVSSQNQ